MCVFDPFTSPCTNSKHNFKEKRDSWSKIKACNHKVDQVKCGPSARCLMQIYTKLPILTAILFVRCFLFSINRYVQVGKISSKITSVRKCWILPHLTLTLVLHVQLYTGMFLNVNDGIFFIIKTYLHKKYFRYRLGRIRNLKKSER